MRPVMSPTPRCGGMPIRPPRTRSAPIIARFARPRARRTASTRQMPLRFLQRDSRTAAYCSLSCAIFGALMTKGVAIPNAVEVNKQLHRLHFDVLCAVALLRRGLPVS